MIALQSAPDLGWSPLSATGQDNGVLHLCPCRPASQVLLRSMPRHATRRGLHLWFKGMPVEPSPLCQRGARQRQARGASQFAGTWATATLRIGSGHVIPVAGPVGVQPVLAGHILAKNGGFPRLCGQVADLQECLGGHSSTHLPHALSGTRLPPSCPLSPALTQQKSPDISGL